MTKRSYQDKVVWITGASSGIGEALAYAFAKEGARLILSARRIDRLEEVKAKCQDPEKVILVPLDIADYKNLKYVIDPIIEKIGQIDVLVNNAGIGQHSTVVETNLETIERVMAVNFFGQVAMTKAILPIMLKQKSGQICVISSIAGKLGYNSGSTYCASKHALHGYFDSLRTEIWKDNISVTLICPGFVVSEISIHGLKGDGTPFNVMDKVHINGMDTNVAAMKMIKALKAGKEEVIIARWEKIAVYLKRFFPGLLRSLGKHTPWVSDS